MYPIIEKLFHFLSEILGGKSRKQKEMLDQFSSFVKDQLNYLMEQVKAFQQDYIQVSKQLNNLYEEMRTLNERLTQAAGESCKHAHECSRRE